ncbi:hypothetical protein GS461_22765, partial [Rhodococcus hoagii]|nr:hypothetical protein [Prescottella equi]
DGASNIGSPVTPVNGVATLTHTFDTAGSHAITAQFTAGRGFDDSTSTVQTVAVSNPDVATSLSLSAPASAETGSSVDLTATVTPANAQGSVQFTDNGAPIGSPVPVANGSATLPHTFHIRGHAQSCRELHCCSGFHELFGDRAERDGCGPGYRDDALGDGAGHSRDGATRHVVGCGDSADSARRCAVQGRRPRWCAAGVVRRLREPAVHVRCCRFVRGDGRLHGCEWVHERVGRCSDRHGIRS